MKSALQMLRDMREVLSEPGAWTSWDEATDRWGHPVNPISNQAYALSLDGAYSIVSPPYNPELFVERGLIIAEMERLIGLPKPWLNWEQKPGRTHAQVLAALDNAIERGEAELGEDRT